MDKFIEKLCKSSLGNLPYASDLGNQVELPSEVYKKLMLIKDYTKKDGRERALNVYVAFNELIATDHTIGTNENVKTNDKISLRMEPNGDKYFNKIVEINDKVYLKKKESLADFNKMDRNIYSTMTFHTHPLHDEYNFKTWGFFSDIDINSLVSAKSLPSMGLVTKSIWLLVKVRSSDNPDVKEYSSLYHSLYNADIPNYQPLIDYLNAHGLAVFHSEGSVILKRR